MPVLPEVGSTITLPSVNSPFQRPRSCSRRSALHAGGVATFDLGEDGGFAALGHVVEAHQGGVANGLAVIGVNARHGKSEIDVVGNVDRALDDALVS